MPRLNRRNLLRSSSVLAAGLAAPEVSPSSAAAASIEFASRWSQANDRVWLGSEYWANPLQDWRVAGGRIECVNAAPDRNVHLLTHGLGEGRGSLRMSVRVGRTGGEALGAGKGSAGFRIGIQGPLKEYRNSLIFGAGLNAGLTAEGALFIGEIRAGKGGVVPAEAPSVELRLSAQPAGDGYVITLAAHDGATGNLLRQVTREGVPAERLVGNLALVANYGQAGGGPARGMAAAGVGRFWFADWRAEGDKLTARPKAELGPILFSSYTLSGGVMKMTAQMPPLGEKDSRTVRLQTADGKGNWKTLAEAPIHPQARTAAFRIAGWDDRKDLPYRLAYTLRDASGRETEHFWTGTVRRDPVDRPVLTVADVSCNIHAAFPNAHYTANMAKLDPDLIAFTGDQFYESSGGYGIVRQPMETAILDYLRKWYLHGWTWRELTRDRPSVSLPDDHDVYQGNIWGEGGAPRRTTQEAGGYDMAPEWVEVVHRTQASHHPDPYDPTPVQQGISVYYGPLTYGRVSFAILEDRKFKTGPEGVVPPTGGRGDHVKDPNFDPKTADVPGAELLGERQMKFLREWAADWRGADMKAVISQTVFTAMATTHGGNRERLRADYDANGWPQTPRNQAVREIRKAFAVHLAGDQHLPAVVQYGIETHGDGPVAFAGPAVNVGYPRWWEPTEQGKNPCPGLEGTGEFTDHFGHPLTVLAVKNGATEPRRPVLENLQDKASGLAVVRFDKAKRQVSFECWPFLADPTAPGTQFPGWPVAVDVLRNGGKPAAWLPLIRVKGAEDPVLQVVDEGTGEVVYTLRIPGREFRPHVLREGRYTVRLGESPERGKRLTGLVATREKDERVVEVTVRS